MTPTGRFSRYSRISWLALPPCPGLARPCPAMKKPVSALAKIYAFILYSNQLLHSAWSRQLSPENWCLGVENGLFPEFGGHFWVFLAIFGCKTGTFPHFLWSRHPSAGTLRFWGHSSFVERRRSGAARSDVP